MTWATLNSLWLIDWLIDWLVDWLVDWLIDWLIDWLVGWLTDIRHMASIMIPPSVRPPHLSSTSSDLDLWPSDPQSWPFHAFVPLTTCANWHRNRFIRFQSITELDRPITLIILFLVSHFNFLFVLCGRLSWLSVSFLLHVKYPLSYRIVSCSQVWWQTKERKDERADRLRTLCLCRLSVWLGEGIVTVMTHVKYAAATARTWTPASTAQSIYDRREQLFRLSLTRRGVVSLPAATAHFDDFDETDENILRL